MTTNSGGGKRRRRWGVLPLAAAATLLVWVAASCGRKSGVTAVREQVATTSVAPATPATDGAGPVAAAPATLGTAYARFLEQPTWSEEAQEPLNFVVVRGTVRGTGDKFEGWFMVGGAAPVLHHFMVNGQSQPAERFAAYAGAAALRQALR